MARKKHFYLNIESIPSVIDDYFKANTQFEHEIANNDDSGLLLKIKKGNSTGILNLFYSKGRVSYSVQGRMKEKAEECWNYIKQQAALPNTEHKTYTIKDVSKEDFNEYKKCLDEYESYTLEDMDTSDSNVINRFKVTGRYEATVVFTYYKNGTLYLQGTISSLFLSLIVETLPVITTIPSDIIAEVISNSTTKLIVVEENLGKSIENLNPIRGSVIEKMILSSIQLVNSAVPIEDYGCFVLGILKATDAIMSKKLVETTGTPFESYGTYFGSSDGGVTYHFKKTDLDSNPELKKSMEQAYAYYIDKRTASFHIDRTAIETSTVLSYDAAVEIVEESLKHINNICKNW